jgi:hypothetical protein
VTVPGAVRGRKLREELTLVGDEPHEARSVRPETVSDTVHRGRPARTASRSPMPAVRPAPETP